jgi:hypothetical protein
MKNFLIEMEMRKMEFLISILFNPQFQIVWESAIKFCLNQYLKVIFLWFQGKFLNQNFHLSEQRKRKEKLIYVIRDMTFKLSPFLDLNHFWRFFKPKLSQIFLVKFDETQSNLSISPFFIRLLPYQKMFLHKKEWKIFRKKKGLQMKN